MPLRPAALLFLPTVLSSVIPPRDPAPAPRAAEMGIIVGTVEISRALASRRPQFRIYSDPSGNVASAPRDDLAAEMRNVVVYLDADRGSPLPAGPDAPPAIMSQREERFDPHVVTVVAGGRVDFPNQDNVYHNVFSLSSARTFDLGRYPRGATKGVSFSKRGVVPVFCHIHADMSGVVLVVPNTYFASPSEAGRFEIANVPPGEYSIVGWHERTRPVTKRVRVVAGQTTTVDFSLPLSSEQDR